MSEVVLTRKQKNIKILSNIGFGISLAIFFFILLRVPDEYIQNVLLKKIDAYLWYIIFSISYFILVVFTKYSEWRKIIIAYLLLMKL